MINLLSQQEQIYFNTEQLLQKAYNVMFVEL